MNKLKLIVRPESANLWWGIYGFCEKTGWEDLNIFNSREEKIGQFCLNTKSYLREGVEDLRNNLSEAKFVQTVDNYLADNKIHYWFYYNEPFDENFYEVPYQAPTNERGEKPRFMDIWHSDESIDISTIHSAVTDFATTFLKLNNIEIEIIEGGSLDESFESFKEHQKYFGSDENIDIAFSDKLIEELSVLWKKSPKEVLDKLNKTIK
jgi:hypothetical protein